MGSISKGYAMRHLRVTLAALVGATVLTGVTLATTTGAATPSLASCKASIASHEYTKGKLTVATDSPAYPPWFVGNKPNNQKGYESAFVYALAKVLGVSSSNVKWVVEPFDNSYTPGPKAFDFDINEISYSAARARAVTFSNSYYDVEQSIVALKTNPIATKHSPAQLKTYLYGDQIGTTGLAYINQHIKPTRTPRVFSTLDQAVLALKNGQIDAIVIDTPTGQYMATAQILGKHNRSSRPRSASSRVSASTTGCCCRRTAPWWAASTPASRPCGPTARWPRCRTSGWASTPACQSSSPRT